MSLEKGITIGRCSMNRPWVNFGYFQSNIGSLPLWELQASGLASLHFGKLGPQWCSLQFSGSEEHIRGGG